MPLTQYNRLVVGIYETFSKRLKKRERAGQPDVYQYDELPGELRVQINHVWNSSIGSTYPRTHHYTDASRGPVLFHRLEAAVVDGELLEVREDGERQLRRPGVTP